jgi:hypothetical protein
MYIKDCFTIIKFKELFSFPNSQFLSYQPFLVSFSFIQRLFSGKARDILLWHSRLVQFWQDFYAKALPCSLFGHYSTRNILTKICMQKPNFPTFLVIPMYSAVHCCINRLRIIYLGKCFVLSFIGTYLVKL